MSVELFPFSLILTLIWASKTFFEELKLKNSSGGWFWKTHFAKYALEGGGEFQVKPFFFNVLSSDKKLVLTCTFMYQL